jgi:hypothetical protein
MVDDWEHSPGKPIDSSDVNYSSKGWPSVPCDSIEAIEINNGSEIIEILNSSPI